MARLSGGDWPRETDMNGEKEKEKETTWERR